LRAKSYMGRPEITGPELARSCALRRTCHYEVRLRIFEWCINGYLLILALFAHFVSSDFGYVRSLLLLLPGFCLAKLVHFAVVQRIDSEELCRIEHRRFIREIRK